MSVTVPRIVQISDMHLFADKETALLGIKTHESLSALVDLVKQDATQPDLIILSGDLSQDHTEQSYLNLVEIFDQFKIPIYCVPGNHDESNIMTRLFPLGSISNVKNVLLDKWQIILLSSQKHRAVEGFLDALQLAFMEECLRNNPNHHAIIVFHHQPVPIGCAWIDPLGLENADTFWETVKAYPNVNTVLFGHVHQEFVSQKNGVKIYSTPSTCLQFKPNTPEFSLDYLPPAYRWIDLHANGALTTGIKRCAEYVGVFDANAKGY